MTVSTDEFLRRFLIHVLPTGLVRIRHFGLFANRRRTASLLCCREVLGAPSSPRQPQPTIHTRCPLCSGDMLIVERITSSQLPTRRHTVSTAHDHNMIRATSINAACRRAHARNAAPRLLALLRTRMCRCSLLAPIELAPPPRHARLSPAHFSLAKRLLNRLTPIEIP
jgi:hypothetical protein